MKYQYHDLSSGQFEDLVIGICEELFGIATQGFADGVDGGRDARFEGVAQVFPSTTKPWTGLTIIQAKHTSGINRSFSDSDFFGNLSSQIELEIPKVKNLYDKGELKNYVIFSNRKLTANKNEEILTALSKNVGLPKENIHLIGVKGLERYLKRFPNAVESANLSVFDEPLKITPDDLAEIIEVFSKDEGIYSTISALQPAKKIKRVEFIAKNQNNELSEEYAKIIKDHMFKDGHFDSITNFLNHPNNSHLRKLYEEVAEEFKTKIVIHKNDYENFERILDYIYDRLISRDPDLNKNKRKTRVFLHYMYFFCDIG